MQHKKYWLWALYSGILFVLLSNGLNWLTATLGNASVGPIPFYGSVVSIIGFILNFPIGYLVYSIISYIPTGFGFLILSNFLVFIDGCIWGLVVHKINNRNKVG
jgi:hypothetical protein